MAVADRKSSSSSSSSDSKLWGFFSRPFRQSSSSQTVHHHHPHQNHSHQSSQVDGSIPHGSTSVSSVARSLLPTRRRLKLDPSNKLYFPCMFFLLFCFSFIRFRKCVYLWIFLWGFSFWCVLFLVKLAIWLILRLDLFWICLNVRFCVVFWINFLP